MITVTVNGIEYNCSPGQTLEELLQRTVHSQAPAFPCGGHGKCGKCKIHVSGNVTPPTESERRLLSEAELAAGIRLACRTMLLGDAAINTLGFGSGGTVKLDGVVNGFRLYPAFKQYGVAVDIGTTTIAAALYDIYGQRLAAGGIQNPQRSFGADVISRMEAALAGHGAVLRHIVREAINELVRTLAFSADLSIKELDGAVITGNTVMLSLFAGVDTEPLTHAPFTPVELFGRTMTAADAGLDCMCPEAPVYLPPCIAAFIGADTVCAMLATGMCARADVGASRAGAAADGGVSQAATAASAGRSATEAELLTDIGTNGEMVLRRDSELFACSTAAGPAFEGAGISMGMGGFDGAVDRVRLAPGGGFDVHVLGEELGCAPKGICGSGLVDAVACLLRAELIDETGYMEDEPCVLAAPVQLTQADIRAVQLAKSAISAGLRTLLKTAGTRPEDVGALHIAGGFGSYLDVHNAGVIGLIPAELTEKVRIAGNAALSGASMLLLSLPLRDRAAALPAEVNTVELSTDPFFAEEFMTGMLF